MLIQSRLDRARCDGAIGPPARATVTLREAHAASENCWLATYGRVASRRIAASAHHAMGRATRSAAWSVRGEALSDERGALT